MSVDRELFVAKTEEIAAEEPAYRHGGSGTDGTCDCIGIIIGAIRRAGGQWRGIHGCNYAARTEMKNLDRIVSTGDLIVGEVVYRVYEPGQGGYNLPERYGPGGQSYTGDLRDYYHVGIVESVHPLRIRHMTKPKPKMDTSIDKYEPAEDMVYLYKIHGSVNWIETETLENNYFEIEEVYPPNKDAKNAVLIYPTPTKQDKSLGSPYVDLFREFQHKLLEPHSVLFVIGYSFSDRHVNEIIYRALSTNSTLNVVIFGKKPDEKEKKEKPIFFIDDNRIFTINGKIEETDTDGNVTKTHVLNHFDYIVNELLPNLDAFRMEDDLMNKFVREFKKQTAEDEDRKDHFSGV